MTTRHVSVLYRGPLESCNYGCAYCPFAKRVDDRAALERDSAALARFVAWVRAYGSPIAIFFTPWGEALTRRWYRDAMVELASMEHVTRVVVQTNLSARLDFLAGATTSKIAFWCTYHPEWTTRDRFVERTAELDAHGASYSIGVVGMRHFIPEIVALRAELQPETYLWVNAVKSHGGGERYTPEEVATLAAIDPLFEVNAVRHPSRGRACATGETVVSIDGDGNVRRCHFVDEQLGNIYERHLSDLLLPRACPNATCSCHIGYVHMPELGLRDLFGAGILERIPDCRRLPLAGV